MGWADIKTSFPQPRSVRFVEFARTDSASQFDRFLQPCPTTSRPRDIPAGNIRQRQTDFSPHISLSKSIRGCGSGRFRRTESSRPRQPPQPTLQDNTDSNVQELKNQIQDERQKEQRATMAAAAMGDPALASATPAQQAAAATYGPTGVAALTAPCAPGRPCPQTQQGNMQMQVTPEQQ